ncbi:BLUF domain-containing protein [Gillisia sp. M10.2A]|uniref:BLUF domain-containing protein n=1 Tax=Gillisia lutea TaxID=2909668 RepID=A0ABS9ELM7_9FLAO|nr:BLUF domain-containing protein [Gillisia lutea]MCF4102361.1 BLUF domain-containing protein [Gillisia lutea]
MRFAISYVSTVDRELNEKEIIEVLDWSKNWNNSHNITGLLLYSEGNFFQVIEGEKEDIKSLFERIKQDSRHHNIIKIFEREIHKEAFDGYISDFISENTQYKRKTVENYINHIKVLDESTQKAVINILGHFIDNNC